MYFDIVGAGKCRLCHRGYMKVKEKPKRKIIYFAVASNPIYVVYQLEDVANPPQWDLSESIMQF